MKMKAKYCDKIGRFTFTYKYKRICTNNLSIDDMCRLRDIMNYYCDNGVAIVENYEIKRLLKENEDLKKQIEKYEKK